MLPIYLINKLSGEPIISIKLADAVWIASCIITFPPSPAGRSAINVSTGE